MWQKKMPRHTDDGPTSVPPVTTDVVYENSRGSQARQAGTTTGDAMVSYPEGYERDCSRGEMISGEPHSRGWSAPMATRISDSPVITLTTCRGGDAPPGESASGISLDVSTALPPDSAME